ncbi:MAG TPA: hypothetical protein VHL77_06890 [Ferruginibacter sp.]|jgi:hypothetical protein|nr:hypothetical protein [Ferruginibacter sp.]
MKFLFTLLTIFTCCLSALAQPETVTVSYQKVDRQAVSYELPFPERTIMDAIDAKMQQLGYKGKDSKGFTVYRSVSLPELGNGEYDLYFMAERQSKRNKDNSTVTLMISKGGDNFATSNDDGGLFTKAKKYLGDLVLMVTAYDLEVQVKEADKKYKELVSEGESLEKKRKSIEKDIDDNKKSQENQLAEMEKQKQKLEALKGDRKQ